jgi:hypothetical protein
MIIGAMKSGTTSIFHYLGQHPAVLISPLKEPNFYALAEETSEFRPGCKRRIGIKTQGEYEALFAGVTSQHAAWGEGSVKYLYNPNVPGRIHEQLPHIKLIAILRNPLDRSYSHYSMNRRNGLETEKDFETAFHLADARIADGWDPHTFGYKQVGLYGEQLKRYFDLFSREQLQVHFYEDLKHAPGMLMVKLFRFLGVDTQFEVDFRPYYQPGYVPRKKIEWLTARGSLVNQFLYAENSRVKQLLRTIVRPFLPKHLHGNVGTHILFRKKPPLDDDARDRLRPHFRQDLLQLQDLLRCDISHWL